MMGFLMGFWSAEYRLPRDLARFEPVTIFFQHRFKMVWEVWGGRGGGLGAKNHCVGTQTCPSVICKIFSDRTWLGSAKGLSKEHVMLRACPSCSLTNLSLHFLVAGTIVSYSYNTTGQAPSQRSGRAAATNFNEVHEIGVHGNQELSSFVAPGLRPTSAKVLYRQSVQLAVGIRKSPNSKHASHAGAPSRWKHVHNIRAVRSHLFWLRLKIGSGAHDGPANQRQEIQAL